LEPGVAEVAVAAVAAERDVTTVGAVADAAGSSTRREAT